MKIEIKNISKRFKDNIILNNINMTLNEGKIYGLAGRNGTGKSVFCKIICGLYFPTDGTILYDGKEINVKKTFPKNISALIEKPNFFSELTGYENLKLLADIKKEIGKEEILKALETVNLINEKDKKFSKYSLGMKQKLGIAQAIMEDNQVIILDEPFNGIENITVLKIKSYLKELASNGKTIIISSHIKDDLEELCDEIYYFENGNCINNYDK